MVIGSGKILNIRLSFRDRYYHIFAFLQILVYIFIMIEIILLNLFRINRIIAVIREAINGFAILTYK